MILKRGGVLRNLFYKKKTKQTNKQTYGIGNTIQANSSSQEETVKIGRN